MADGSTPQGTINFFGTHIGAWEENVDASIYDRFRSVLARLRDHRGFRVRQDESVHKLIRRGYYDGRKGEIEVRARASGRMFEIEFFQGKDRSLGQFERMPRTMQLACAVEMSHVLRKLLELGYVLEGRRQGITSADLLPVLRHAQGRTDDGNPLAAFNRSWNFESDWKRGGRFERDESGWPTAAAVSSGWLSKDRDGRPLASGETLYCRHNGRLFRGVARPGPNENWMLISHGSVVRVHPRELFRCEDPDAEQRRLVPKQLERVRSELEKALKANAFRRVEALARVSAMLSPSPSDEKGNG